MQVVPLAAAAIAAVISVPLSLGAALAEQPQAPSCDAPAEFVRLPQPLLRTALALASGEPVLIVALGSSSTEGAGASSPANSYPARLEAELNARFPGNQITVLNRGIGGEDARQMLARFEQSVIKEVPDLVLWQVGTNAVLRDHSLAGEEPLIFEGIRRLKASHADVVLIDSQYAPKVLAKPGIEGMIKLMSKAARQEKVGLFRRFAIMRHWVEAGSLSFETLLSPDGLHMNDFSYGCVAKLLGAAIADAVRSPALAKARVRH